MFKDKPILFTTKTCSYCPTVKKYLESKKVPYEIIDVSEQVKLLEPAYRISGVYTVPQLLYKDEVIVGLNYAKLSELCNVYHT